MQELLNYAKIMDEVATDLTTAKRKPYKSSAEISGTRFIATKIEMVERNGAKFVVLEADDFFTFTWHPQPIRIINRILSELGPREIMITVLPGDDRKAQYRII